MILTCNEYLQMVMYGQYSNTNNTSNDPFESWNDHKRIYVVSATQISSLISYYEKKNKPGLYFDVFIVDEADSVLLTRPVYHIKDATKDRDSDQRKITLQCKLELLRYFTIKVCFSGSAQNKVNDMQEIYFGQAPR